MTKINRQKVYGKYGGHCAYCGKELKITEMQVDHIHPKSCNRPIGRDIYGNYIYQDIDRFENLNPSCRRCNFYKGASPLEMFRDQIKTITERLRKPFIFKLSEQYGLVELKKWDGVFYFEKQLLTTKTNKHDKGD